MRRFYKSFCVISRRLFKKFMLCEGNLTIDESMVAYYKKVLGVKFMPNKPHRFGFVGNVLAHAAKPYAFHLDLYRTNSRDKEYNTRKAIVTRMMDAIDPFVKNGSVGKCRFSACGCAK